MFDHLRSGKSTDGHLAARTSGISIIMLLITFTLGGCLQQQTKPQTKISAGMEEIMPAYSGPRAKAAVTDFSWSTGGQKTTFGVAGIQFNYSNSTQAAEAEGLKDMLTTAMVQSKRFRVLERQNIDSLKSEIDLQEDGYTDDTGVQRGDFKGVDLVVMAAVTGWDPGTSGTKGSIAGLLGKSASALIGAANAGYKTSSMAMDIRIVDSRTSEILAATSVETTAKDVNIGGALGVLTGGSGLGGGLSTYANTPMEKAIRSTIMEATKFIAENVPQEYMVH